MKKKILSLVLVVAMLASMLVFAPVSGATKAEVVIETTTVEGSVGDTVSVDVVVHYNGLIYGGQFAYEYDATKLQLNGITRPDGASGELSNKASATFGAAVAEGPYDVIVSTYTKSFDATEGVVMATLNFTILEGASGEAVVSVRNIMRDPQYPVTRIYNSATDTSYTADIECVAGGVTVLPEGYIDPNAGALSDFNYTGGRNAATIISYKGNETGTLVIPSQAPKDSDPTTLVPVTKIGLADSDAGVIGGKSFATILFPASVTSFAEATIYEHKADLKVIVLNPTVAFHADAIVDCYGSVTICAPVGSTAEAYASKMDYAFEALDLCSLTVDGATYLVGSKAQAPGVMAIGDETVIGWKSNDGKTYGAGETMALTGATTLEPVTIKTPKMNTEVGFMLTDKITTSRMRYTTNMTVADYNTLASLGTVTLGTIITPAKYVSMAGGLTKEALTQLAIDNVDKIGALPDGKTGAGLTYIDVPASAANPFGKTADIYTFAGSLAGFKAENIDLAYAAAFYATVELADGSSFTIYSAFDFGANRAVGATVEAAKAKAETKELKKAYDDLIEMIKANTSTAN